MVFITHVQGVILMVTILLLFANTTVESDLTAVCGNATVYEGACLPEGHWHEPKQLQSSYG